MTSFLDWGEIRSIAVSDGRGRPAKQGACLSGREAKGADRGVGIAAARIDDDPGDPTAWQPTAEVGRPPIGDPDESTLRSPEVRIGDPAPGMAANGSRDGAVAGVSLT